MSIQHRARIKTVANYSQYLSDIGGCCPPDSDPDGALENTTYQQCVSLNGYFIPGDPPYTCPDLATKGCCCACSYVDDFDAFFEKSGCEGAPSCGEDGYADCYDGGLKEVSECECRAVGGSWAGAGTLCSTYQSGGTVPAWHLCNPQGGEGDNSNDVRWPGACCPGGEESCQNLCFADDCFAIQGSEPGAYYEFGICYGEDLCGREPALCNDQLAMRTGTRDRNGLLIIRDNKETLDIKRKNLAKQEINYNSACVYKNEERNVVCSNETKKLCEEHLVGMWFGLDGSGFAHSCSSSIVNDLKSYIENNKMISQSIVDSWELGKSYLGLDARYAGVIFSKSSVKGQGVEYWGNTDTGKPETQKINARTTNIIPGSSYAVFVHSSTVRKSSKNAHQYLKSISDKTFKFKLPDLETLGFLYNSVRTPEFVKNSQIQENNNTKWLPFKDEYYLSSTNLSFNGSKNNDYIHIQNMQNGFTSTCSVNKLIWTKGVLLIRIG